MRHVQLTFSDRLIHVNDWLFPLVDHVDEQAWSLFLRKQRRRVLLDDNLDLVSTTLQDGIAQPSNSPLDMDCVSSEAAATNETLAIACSRLMDCL